MLQGQAATFRKCRLEALLNSTIEFVIIATDPERRITEWNTGAERVLGWSAEEMRGQPADRLFTPEDMARGEPAIEAQRALEAGHTANERWHMRRDGSRFWASGEMMPWRGQDGAHLGFLKIMRDRTDQHETEKALQRTDALRLALLELGDRLRDMEDTADMASTAAEIMGRVLGASRAGYGTMDAAEDTVIIERDWTAPGVRWAKSSRRADQRRHHL